MTDKLGRPFLIRPYREADRASLEAMYMDFMPKRAAQGLPPEGEERVRQWLGRVLPKGVHIVVEAENRVIGHAMLIPMNHADDAESAEFANFLHQSVRNRGIGTALARVAVDEAKTHGFERMWLSVEPSNRPAVRSYEKVGFRPLPGFPFAPEIEMERRL